MMGGKSNKVLVERDVYEAMMKTFHKVTAEREKNMELAAKLKKDLGLLDRELTKIGSKVTELVASIATLEESTRRIEDYALKKNLLDKIGYAMYMIDGTQSKLHRIREAMEAIKRDVKPWEDVYQFEKIV